MNKNPAHQPVPGRANTLDSLFRRRAGLALLAGCLGLGVVPASVSLANDNPDRVAVNDVPRPARLVLEQDVRGAKEAQYYRDGNVYFAHYTLPNGLRLETRVRRDGSGYEVTPNRNQPELSKGETRRLFDQFVEFRHHEEERAKEEAVAAANAAREAESAREAAARLHELRERREEEARLDHARRLNEHDAAEFYAGRTYRTVEFDAMPRDVRRSLHDICHEGSAPEYYAFRRRGSAYFAVQYTTPRGRRIEAVVDEDGTVVERIELADWATPSRDIRDRDAAWDHEHGWDRDHERVNRYWIPGGAREALDNLIPDASDVDFFRCRQHDRLLYVARYTDRHGRRVESRVTERGEVVETVRLYEFKTVGERTAGGFGS